MTAISAYYLKGIYLAAEFASLDFKHCVNMQGASRLLNTSSVATKEHLIKSSYNNPCRNTSVDCECLKIRLWTFAKGLSTNRLQGQTAAGCHPSAPVGIGSGPPSTNGMGRRTGSASWCQPISRWQNHLSVERVSF